MRYDYKLNKSATTNKNGVKERYLQIWKIQSDGTREYVDSLGKPENALKILVKAKRFDELTKEYPVILTKMLDDEKKVFDQNLPNKQNSGVSEED